MKLKRKYDIGEFLKYQLCCRVGKRVPRKLKKKYTVANRVKWKAVRFPDGIHPFHELRPAKSQEEYDRRKAEKESFQEFHNSLISCVSKSIGLPVEVLNREYRY